MLVHTIVTESVCKFPDTIILCVITYMAQTLHWPEPVKSFHKMFEDNAQNFLLLPSQWHVYIHRKSASCKNAVLSVKPSFYLLINTKNLGLQTLKT